MPIVATSWKYDYSIEVTTGLGNIDNMSSLIRDSSMVELQRNTSSIRMVK